MFCSLSDLGGWSDDHFFFLPNFANFIKWKEFRKYQKQMGVPKVLLQNDKTAAGYSEARRLWKRLQWWMREFPSIQDVKDILMNWNRTSPYKEAFNWAECWDMWWASSNWPSVVPAPSMTPLWNLLSWSVGWTQGLSSQQDTTKVRGCHFGD